MNRRTIKKTDINGWNEEEENILKGWADRATCYNWLHNKAHEQCFRTNAMFTIPVIVISTVTGAANFAVEKLGDKDKAIALMIIGAFSILAGIIQTVAQFLRIAEINEGHRVATIAWDKFARNVKIELAKNPIDRRPASELVKVCKEEFDRLIETSPKLNNKIIIEFNKVFGSLDIIKPEITGIIQETFIFDRSKLEWEEDKAVHVNVKEEVEKFKRNYFENNGRFPTENEITNHFPTYNINFDENGDVVNKLISIVIDSPESQESHDVHNNNDSRV
jgi:hypothetical protein